MSSPLDLLKLIAAEFGVTGRFESKADYLIALNRMLLERLRSGRNTVLIIDEAQNLRDDALEEIRLLSNLETDTHKLMQIVLTGQPELLRKLSQPSLRQLRQRIAIEHHMEPLERGRGPPLPRAPDPRCRRPALVKSSRRACEPVVLLISQAVVLA